MSLPAERFPKPTTTAGAGTRATNSGDARPEPIFTLADTPLGDVRCLSCAVLLPRSTPIEIHRGANLWAVVECPECKTCSPYLMESTR